MTWFEALKLATQLITLITPIIGQAFHHGGEELDASALPDKVKEKVVQLADQVQAR